MANIVTTTKLSENVNEVVFAFHLQYVDTGDESAQLKVDVSAAADTNVIMLHLTENQSGYVDFRSVGGLPNTKTLGTNPTGDIKFTTTGLGAAGDSYQIVMRLKKKY